MTIDRTSASEAVLGMLQNGSVSAIGSEPAGNNTDVVKKRLKDRLQKEVRARHALSNHMQQTGDIKRKVHAALEVKCEGLERQYEKLSKDYHAAVEENQQLGASLRTERAFRTATDGVVAELMSRCKHHHPDWLEEIDGAHEVGASVQENIEHNFWRKNIKFASRF